MASDKELIRSDIEAYLRRYQDKELLRFVAVGSVDDGKSTLIGRLLFDTGSIYDDQLEAMRKATHMEGTDVDLSLLTDGLAAEREQGITIDVAYRYFSTDKRKFIIADTPGHVQYTRNMVTGASTANVAIILIDARLGVLQQSRRHAYIASLLGIPHLAVCVNKMDLVAYDREVFTRIETDFAAFTRNLSFSGVTFFPISALSGANCVHRSAATEWYDGPTVLEFLEAVPVQQERDLLHFRYPVQYVSRPNLDYRGFAGRIASGVVRKGDPIAVLPSGKTSRVKSIDTFDGEIAEAFAPQSVTLRLEDEVDVSRGDMLVHPGDAPRVARTFDAHLVWMHDIPLELGRNYLLKHTSQTVRVDVDRVHWRKDMDTLAETPAATLGLNDIGRVTLTAHRELFLDPYDGNRETGSFILIDPIANGTLAAGMVLPGSPATTPDTRTATAGERERGSSLVSERERRTRFGALGCVVFLRGAAEPRALGLAHAIERRLFDAGAVAVVLTEQGAGDVARAAGALADAGVPAIVVPAGDAASPRALAEAGDSERRLLTVRLGPAEVSRRTSHESNEVTLGDATSPEAGADAVLAALRDRGWLGRSANEA